MKQLGIEDTADDSGVCTVLKINENGCTSSSNVDMRYTCDTEGGSSGSPVVLYNTNKIIGLHHCGGGCTGNMGVMINEIAPLIIDDIIPQPTAAPVPTTSPTGTPTVFCDGKYFRLTLRTDDYPAENDFILKGDDSQTYMSKASTGITFSADTQYDFDQVCLSAQSYEFSITDTYGDGICCTYGEGFYRYTVGTTVKEGGQFTNQETSTFTVGADAPVSSPTQPPVPSPTQ